MANTFPFDPEPLETVVELRSVGDDLERPPIYQPTHLPDMQAKMMMGRPDRRFNAGE